MKDQAEQQDVWIADRRLWLTPDKSRAVEDGDPAAAFLLIAPGQGMSRARAEELGVIRDTKQPQSKTESDADLKEKSKPEDKQKAKPATKSRKPKK